MWRLQKPLELHPGKGLPEGVILPAERRLMDRWARESPKEYRRLVKAGTAHQAARNALTLQEQMELELRAQNPGMTAMEADQHTRHVLSVKPRDPS